MVSHKHRCIFIHIPKTAGMSIENSFLKSLGLKFYRGQCPSLLLVYNQDKSIGPPSLAHLTPFQYVDHSYLSKELFESYFKFSFVRNPWERIVSIYKYFKYHKMMTFEDFLKVIFPYLWKERYDFVRPQVDFLYDRNGNQIVDFIGRFESLKKDMDTVKTKLAHPLADLSHINKPPGAHNWYSRWTMRFIFKQLKKNPGLFKHLYLFSPVNKNYREYYTPVAQKIVESYYQEDIERFKYEF